MKLMSLPGHWLASGLGLSPDMPVPAFLAWAIDLAVYLFVLRTVLTYLGRKAGLSHPDHYHRWPRVPWRMAFKAWLALKRWHERVFQMGKRSTGGFAGVLATLTLMYRPGFLILGRAYAWGLGLLQPIGVKVERHLFMYAMTGAGKTTSLITLISLWRNSVFCIDPKAQITNALFAHDWRTWYVLDPYGISNAISACFNAIDCLKDAVKRDGSGAAVLLAMRIAQALIVTPAGSRSPYFTDTARGFLTGLILHVLTWHDEADDNLPFIRDLIVRGYQVFDENGECISTDDEAHELLLRQMMKNPAFDGAIIGAAAAMMSASRETGGNVRSTLQEQTKWLDIPPVRAILRSTTLPLSQLKTRKDVALSVTAPVLSVREELSPLCRLLTNMIAYTFEAVPEKNGQCLTVLDELPSQGHNETLEVMLAVARSYGLTVLGISQNTELMEKAYPKSWGMFSGEADAVFWMATNHERTAQHLSQILGKKTLVAKDRYTGRKAYREVSVMDPDQVKRFLSPDSGHLIVTRAGGRALKLMHAPYYKALPVWKYAADPAHRETLLRRIVRRSFSSKKAPAPAPDVSEDAAPAPVAAAAPQTPETVSDATVSTANVIPFPDPRTRGDQS